jgi:hypothetical protein
VKNRAREEAIFRAATREAKATTANGFADFDTLARDLKAAEFVKGVDFESLAKKGAYDLGAGFERVRRERADREARERKEQERDDAKRREKNRTYSWGDAFNEDILKRMREEMFGGRGFYSDFGRDYFSSGGRRWGRSQGQSPPPRPSTVDCWRVLGLSSAGATKDQVEKAFKTKARAAHPDMGGSHEAMVELNAARTQALREVR